MSAPMLSVLKDKKGISSLEYVLLAVGILTGLVGGVAALVPQVTPFFTASIPNLL